MNYKCQDCKQRFETWEQSIDHQANGECVFSDNITPSEDNSKTYSEYLAEASNREPTLYSKYIGRENPAMPNNAWNPLFIKEKSHAG